MFRAPRIAIIAATLAVTASGIASANTVELTLTVPLKITLAKTGPAVGPDGQLKRFNVSCAIGSGLGYATGVGAQGSIVGQGSTATSGSVKIQDPTGKLLSDPTATVIITYDDGTNGAGPGRESGSPGTKAPSAYLCWLQWQEPIASLPPMFVQGNLTLGG